VSDSLRRIPAAAWICALVAIVNAVCWSVISPPFQLPDEPDHFAYVQHLAETGHLPSSPGFKYPPAEEVALSYLFHERVQFSQENHTIASQVEQQRLEEALTLPLSRSEPGDAGTAASQPPLYYALETIPYMLGSGGTLLDSLVLMRLFSALLGGVTAFFAFLFLREALAGARWAWTVGGLGVALAPTFGMMSGAVNPDALLFAVASALFYCLARAFRRGLTRGLAIAIGAAIAIGCMTKLTFLGLVPGAIVGLLALALRQARTRGRSTYRSLAPALAIVAAPVGLYLIDDALSSRLTLQVLSGAVSFGRYHKSVLGAIPYIWQIYLPRLPGMSPAFHGISGSWIWFEQVVGKYGWLDTTFPAWVVRVALIPAGLIAVLFLRALVANRQALRARWVEAAVYGLMSLGTLTIIGVDEYVHKVPSEYLQLRYVLPLIALMGAVLALAARGAGRRWGPVAGVFIVLVVLAHDLFSQLLVISRYYG
jgi:4-amino-4-deoxy-L-arabinose transferase-like glycosyltransferase